MQLESASLEAGAPLNTLLPPDFEPRPRRASSDDAMSNSDNLSFGDNRNDHNLKPILPAPATSQLQHIPSTPLTATTQRTEVSGVSSFASSQNTLTEQPDEGGMESEERKAFYARLFVAWTFFFLFWMVSQFPEVMTSCCLNISIFVDGISDLHAHGRVDVRDFYVFLCVLSFRVLSFSLVMPIPGFIAFTTLGYGEHYFQPAEKLD